MLVCPLSSKPKGVTPLGCEQDPSVSQAHSKHRLVVPNGASLDLLGYSDSDFAGSRVDHKSTSGGCHLLGRSLVSWSSKKQNSVALSTAEAEYIAAGAFVPKSYI